MARRGHRDPTAGQASAEYVALLLVAALLLAAAATVTVPGVGQRVVATVRTGLCIVGGDVCRTADAVAAGLAPCLVRERSDREETTLDIAVVRLGDNGEWQIALKSDGGAEVTRLEEDELGAAVGIGLEFSPAGVGAGLSGALVAGYRGGAAWRFEDARAAGEFLSRGLRGEPVQWSRKADVRWRALGGGAIGEAEAFLGELAGAGLKTGADGALGVRSEGDRRTLTLDLGVTAPHLGAELQGFPAASGARLGMVADVSWQAGELRELALRSAAAHGERLEEMGARVDLREPEGRALAERLLRPGATSHDLRALAAHAARRGIVERMSYAVSERRRGFSVGARLGVALGLEHERITADRRLVDAVAWVRGGPAQRRADCLGR